MLTALSRPFTGADFPADLRRAAGHVTVLANIIFNTWPRRIEAFLEREAGRDGTDDVVELLREFDHTWYARALAAYEPVSTELVAACSGPTVPVPAACAHEAVLLFADQLRRCVDVLICDARGIQPSIQLTDPSVLHDCGDEFSALCHRYQGLFSPRQQLEQVRIQLEQESCRAAIARGGYRCGLVTGVPVPNGRAELPPALSNSHQSGFEPPHRQVVPAPATTALIGLAPGPEVGVVPSAGGPAPRPAALGVFRFVRSGNGYYVEGFSERGHLSDYDGLANIARLLSTPGRSVSLAELASVSPDHRSDGEVLPVKRNFSAQPALDAKANAGILADMARLEREAEEAENDVDREDSLDQLEKLRSLWKASTGLGGHSRDLNSIRERLRPRISGRLSTVYAAMEKPGVGLGQVAKFLRSRIGCRGGNYVYTPEPGDPNWET
jgi:hypothetical protein